MQHLHSTPFFPFLPRSRAGIVGIISHPVQLPTSRSSYVNIHNANSNSNRRLLEEIHTKGEGGQLLADGVLAAPLLLMHTAVIHHSERPERRTSFPYASCLWG